MSQGPLFTVTIRDTIDEGAEVVTTRVWMGPHDGHVHAMAAAIMAHHGPDAVFVLGRVIERVCAVQGVNPEALKYSLRDVLKRLSSNEEGS